MTSPDIFPAEITDIDIQQCLSELECDNYGEPKGDSIESATILPTPQPNPG